MDADVNTRPHQCFTKPDLSIIIPVLNEGTYLESALHHLSHLRKVGVELVVADGGSTDGTLSCATAVDHFVHAPKGRAAQMNAGAAIATGRILLFLHADTTLPESAARAVLDATTECAWGRFDVAIDGRSPMLRVVGQMMNWRSRWSGIATGDQAIFVRREVFERVGGFPLQALMEDVELSRRLRRIGRPACLRDRVVTSGRRWERNGVWRTIGLMWTLRLRYWLGASPEELAKAYR